jgi:hypothetical protein
MLNLKFKEAADPEMICHDLQDYIPVHTYDDQPPNLHAS